MHSLTAHNSIEKEMLAMFSDSSKTQADKQQVPDQPLQWAEFLTLLERICRQLHYSLEYDRVEDDSCAIFANIDCWERYPIKQENTWYQEALLDVTPDT